MDLLTLQHFAARLNETFTADIGESEVPFVLVEVVPLPPEPRALRAPFSLMFRNLSPILFPQQTYRMRNPDMGELGIFLVPVARDREGFLYQAVFS
jgi:hypothetical protein